MPIPDDVMRAASEALYSEGAISWSPKHMRSLEVAVARALLAERKKSSDLLDALRMFVTEYVELVDSGDAGFWNAEDEPKVIKARAAIAKAEGRAA